jgi:hypothetical protein
MVSCGYEPSAVIEGFGSLKGFWAMVRGNFGMYPDQDAQKMLSETAPHGPVTLVQIAAPAESLEVTNA